jgi:LuxR family transcriptional regulator, maltose regulon positive regulatory protein
MDLIQSKIQIPNGGHYISRPRLLTTLEESLRSCSATLIIGRAGTGKTTLAMDFIQKTDLRTAWFKIDAPDSNFNIFLRYLVESVAKVRPGFGSNLPGEFLRPPDETSRYKLAEVFIYELIQDLQREEEPLLIVIDDLHLVYDADWVIPFFHRLLPLLPPEVHLLILGRSLPPAPLWRLRSKQRLRVIDEPALAFTLEEAAELSAQCGLCDKQANTAWMKTRGRAAALHHEVKKKLLDTNSHACVFPAPQRI